MLLMNLHGQPFHHLKSSENIRKRVGLQLNKTDSEFDLICHVIPSTRMKLRVLAIIVPSSPCSLLLAGTGT